MPLAVYVYYRVDPLSADNARIRIDELLGRLQRQCGVRARLLTKRGDPHLWMEVYEGVADAAGFESSLQAEAAALNLDALLAAGSRRHIESFEE